MGNCGTCKYWDKEHTERRELKLGLAVCSKVKTLWNSSEWDTDGLSLKLTSDDSAFAQDGSDYLAKLLTKADFECNQWEENRQNEV